MPRSLLPALLALILAGSCRSLSGSPEPLEVLFLTRDGCTNSPAVRADLESIQDNLGFPLVVTYVDVTLFDPQDPRTGYGTPTLLIEGLDLFGAKEPEPAAPT